MTVEPFLAIANFLLPQSVASSRPLLGFNTLVPRLSLSLTSSFQTDKSRAYSSNGKRKEGRADIGNDHAFEHSDWSHIAQHRAVYRTCGLWFSPYRIHLTPPSTTIIPPSAKHALSSVWKGKDVRHFSCQAQAIRCSDTGQANHIPPPSIVDCFVNGNPLPNSSQLVDLKTAWNAFIELRKQSVPPQPFVALGFVDRALSTAEETLIHDDKTRELVRWLARSRRVLKQLGNIKNLSPEESVHVSCLLIRIQALLGRFDDVASSFPRTWDSKNLGRPELRMVETVLQAISRNRDPVGVLDFIVSQCHALGRLLDIASPHRSSRLPFYLSEIAFKIFDVIPSPLAVVANMHGQSSRAFHLTGILLIGYFVRRRVPEDAFDVYRNMQQHSVDIPLALKLWLVRALVRGHAVEQANMFFSEISASIPSGQESKLFLATGLHLFSSQGDISRSEAAFKALENRNLVNHRAIGSRLLVYARNGDVKTTLQYFHHYFPPNAESGDRPDIYHYTAVLMAHAKACDSSGLNRWFENMIADGLKPDRHVYNILIGDCVRRGMFEDAASIVEEMRTCGLPPLCETYTTIIAGLAEHGDPVMAEAYYKKALEENVKPDRQMIASLMTAHSAVGSWKGVIRAYDYLASSDDRHLRPRIDVYNILLKAYVLAGSPFETVSDVFQKMEQSGVRPTVHTFSILIKSAVDSGQMDVARRVFMKLDSLANVWETGFKVNVYALTMLMAGYLRQGDRLKAKDIYDEMLFRGISPSSVTYNSILRAYVSEDCQENIRLASDFMESLMKSPDRSEDWLLTSYSRFSGFENIYSPLMTLFARKARPEQVEELMHAMVEAGGERTLATLTLLLNAYRNTGNVDECRRVWNEILSIALRFFQTGEIFGGSDPNLPRLDLQRKADIICVPLSIHMDALSAAGAHTDVAVLWKTIRRHGFATDSHNWNHLIVVLVRAGEIERAFQILERVIIPSIQHYQLRNDRTTAARERAPPTPLSYDDVPQPQDHHTSTLATEEAPYSRRLYLSTEARESVVAQLAKEREGPFHDATDDFSTSDSDAQTQQDRPGTADFAHSLYILQQILPSWNTWQPHAAVATLLTEVLDHLEAGHMIQPIPPRRSGDAEGSTWQGPESEASAAKKLLGRIHASFPRAVTIVKEYDYRVRVRRELARIVDED